MGAVLLSNLLFSCCDESAKGFHGRLRISMFSFAVRKSRNASLLEAVSGSQRARYAMSHVLHLLAFVAGAGAVIVNIHKLLLALEALGQVEFGGGSGGHGSAAVRWDIGS